MNKRSEQNTKESLRKGVGSAIGRIPSGLFILTARHEDRRAGTLVSWVQQVGFEPPMVSVAVAKDRPILSMVSGSRYFGLCQLREDDKVLLRKFAGGCDPGEDPFLGVDLVSKTQTVVPILANVLAYLECEVKVHVDADSDHDIFVGKVLRGSCCDGQPFIHVRENGFRY